MHALNDITRRVAHTRHLTLFDFDRDVWAGRAAARASHEASRALFRDVVHPKTPHTWAAAAKMLARRFSAFFIYRGSHVTTLRRLAAVRGCLWPPEAGGSRGARPEGAAEAAGPCGDVMVTLLRVRPPPPNGTLLTPPAVPAPPGPAPWSPADELPDDDPRCAYLAPILPLSSPYLVSYIGPI